MHVSNVRRCNYTTVNFSMFHSMHHGKLLICSFYISLDYENLGVETVSICPGCIHKLPRLKWLRLKPPQFYYTFRKEFFWAKLIITLLIYQCKYHHKIMWHCITLPWVRWSEQAWIYIWAGVQSSAHGFSWFQGSAF